MEMNGRNRTSTRLGAALALGIAALAPAAAQVAPTPPVTSVAPTPADAVDRATQPVAPPATPAAQSQARTAEEQRTMPPSDPAFARLDTDGDGRVGPVEADADSQFDAQFDDMDSDDDGFVSTAEFSAFGKAAPPTAQGAEHAAGHSAVATGETFGGLDKDKDGRVSSTEASVDTNFDAGFAAMDANGDGFVSDSEYRAQAKTTGKMEDKQP
jgi:hypothetical protein